MAASLATKEACNSGPSPFKNSLAADSASEYSSGEVIGARAVRYFSMVFSRAGTGIRGSESWKCMVGIFESFKKSLDEAPNRRVTWPRNKGAALRSSRVCAVNMLPPERTRYRASLCKKCLTNHQVFQGNFCCFPKDINTIQTFLMPTSPKSYNDHESKRV